MFFSTSVHHCKVQYSTFRSSHESFISISPKRWPHVNKYEPFHVLRIPRCIVENMDGILTIMSCSQCRCLFSNNWYGQEVTHVSFNGSPWSPILLCFISPELGCQKYTISSELPVRRQHWLLDQPIHSTSISQQPGSTPLTKGQARAESHS